MQGIRRLFSELIVLGIASWTATASGQHLTTQGVVGRNVTIVDPAHAPTPAPARMTSAGDLFARARPHLEAVLGYRLESALNFQVVTPGQVVGSLRQCYPGLADQVR